MVNEPDGYEGQCQQGSRATEGLERALEGSQEHLLGQRDTGAVEAMYDTLN